MSQFPAFNVGTRSAFAGYREPSRAAKRGRVAAQPATIKRKIQPSPISTSPTAASAPDKRPCLSLMRSDDTPPGSPLGPHLPSPVGFDLARRTMPATPPLRSMPRPALDFEAFDLNAFSTLSLESEALGSKSTKVAKPQD